MSTNFVQHNPTETNQQDDTSFDSDTLTTGGLGVDNIVPSDWFNKRLYQDSTMTSALALMMSNKGYTNTDADKNVLASVLSNIITNNDLKPGQITVPYSPTPVFDASLANGFNIALGGNVTSSTLINASPGQIITIDIYNPGNFTFVWPGNVSGALPPNPSGAVPNNNFIQQFFVVDPSQIYSMDSALRVLVNSKQANLGFTPVQQGGGSGQSANKVFIGLSGSRLKAQVDSTDFGNIVFDSNLPAPQPLPSINNNANGAIGIPTQAGVNLLICWAQGTSVNSAVTVTQTVNWPNTFSVIFRAFVCDFFVSGADNDIMSWQITNYNSSNVQLRRARRGDDSAYNSAPIVFGIGLG